MSTVKTPPVRADNQIARVAWAASLAASVLLVLLPRLVKLDGRPHADWQQFLGRLHPVAVHLPIGFLVLIPLLEVAGKRRAALREAAGFVLGLGLLSCLGALALGYLLAYGGGTAGPVVTRHMWGATILSMGVLGCQLARGAWISGSLPRVYPALLAGVLLALAWTAHQGGSITHGGNYLTQYMPSPLQRLLALGHLQSNVLNPDSIYARKINPILDANCVSCHGESKVSGGLRVDSYELLMKGGKDGVVIVPGAPESSRLLQRVTLPADHKGFMPAEGKRPLRAEEIASIRAWIKEGASPAAASIPGVEVTQAVMELPPQPVGDYSALMPEIRQMGKGQGAKLLPVSSKASDGLILNTVDVADSFGDAQLVQFLKFAPYITEAELGRTAVTDASLETLSKFSHLRALHLEGTGVTGEGLGKLGSLSQLTYINLSGTNVRARAVAPLGKMKNLRHVYLYNTPAEPEVKEHIARGEQ